MPLMHTSVQNKLHTHKDQLVSLEVELTNVRRVRGRIGPYIAMLPTGIWNMHRMKSLQKLTLKRLLSSPCSAHDLYYGAAKIFPFTSWANDQKLLSAWICRLHRWYSSSPWPTILNFGQVLTKISIDSSVCYNIPWQSWISLNSLVEYQGT